MDHGTTEVDEKPSTVPRSAQMSVAVVIPARNEEATVGKVVDAAKAAHSVDEVIVVDNASTDATALVAVHRGARVVSQPTGGKGEAMQAGVAATDKELIVFLDADLVGLRPEHVDRLVAAVSDGAGMSCGLFDRGPLLNPVFLHVLPVLTGQRALRRELFGQLPPATIRGYRVEAALNSLVKDLGLPVTAFVCDGLWHRPKEEKFDSPLRGFVAKITMLATAVAAYGSFRLARWAWRRR